jgi:hypothetical protein
MNSSKISRLIIKASKLKKAGKNGEYLAALRNLRSELVKQRTEIDEGIKTVNRKIEDAERNR